MQASLLDEMVPPRYPYQDVGVDFLQNFSRAILADDTGTGKTRMSLDSRHNDSVMVVCPASVKYNWAAEVMKWTSLKPIVLNGRYSFTWPERGQVMITNPEIIPDWVYRPANPVTLLLDEVHAYRNGASSTKFRHAKAVFGDMPAGSQVVGMTATPLVNRLDDICNLLDITGLLDAEFGGRNGFAALCGGKVGKRGVLSRDCEPTPAMLRLLNKFMLRRKKDDVLDDLPEETFSVFRIGGYSRRLKKIMDKGLEALDAYERMSGPVRGKLPAITELSRARRELAEWKAKPVKGMVDELVGSAKKVVMFSAHRKPVDVIGNRPGWTIINGSVSNKRRLQRQDEFQAGKLDGIALTLGAGNSGLNLHLSDTMVLCDLGYSYGEATQALGRIRRVGSKNDTVSYTYCCCDHDLDRRLFQIITEKHQLFEQVCAPCETRE